MNVALVALSSFVVAFSGALVPGPLFTITVSESVKRGAIAGPMIILGHGILELLLVLLLLFGVAPFLTAERARLSIAVIGGAILVVMGVIMIKDARAAKLDIASGGDGRGLHPVISGVVGSLSNPYWLIWWATAGLGYLVASMKYGFAGVAAFFAGHIAADLAWYSLLSLAVSRGRKMIGDRGYRFMLYGCGFFLLGFGAWFISWAAK
ncbi:MAG TPA: LysE family transporter [Candidatus Sulfobium mesophilum]|nr:LysE family transporter [Candidatus Sulfobium mesophilum]